MPAAGVLGRRVVALEGELGSSHLAGALVRDLAFLPVKNFLIKGLGPLNRRAADLAVLALGVGLQPHPGEVGGGLVILVLSPALEGVVVTLVAVEPDRQEQLRGVLHRGVRVAQNLVVRRRRMLPVRARGGHDLAHELVVRHVLVNLVANPAAERHRSLGAQVLPVHLQQVGPLVRPVVDELGRADQPVHQRLALGLRLRRIVQERPQVLGRGRQAGQVQIHPAHELGIGAEPRRLNLEPLPLGGHQFVNPAVGRRIVPHEPGPVAHHRERGGGIGPLEPGQNGGLSSAHGGHQPGAAGGGHLGIAALHERLAGHVAHLAVGVGGQHAHLLAAAQSLHHRLLGS